MITVYASDVNTALLACGVCMPHENETSWVHEMQTHL